MNALINFFVLLTYNLLFQWFFYKYWSRWDTFNNALIIFKVVTYNLRFLRMGNTFISKVYLKALFKLLIFYLHIFFSTYNIFFSRLFVIVYLKGYLYYFYGLLIIHFSCLSGLNFKYARSCGSVTYTFFGNYRTYTSFFVIHFFSELFCLNTFFLLSCLWV